MYGDLILANPKPYYYGKPKAIFYLLKAIIGVCNSVVVGDEEFVDDETQSLEPWKFNELKCLLIPSFYRHPPLMINITRQ